MSKTASIFLHSRRGPCYFQHLLQERGYEVKVHAAPVFDFSEFDPLADDIVYVGGGGIGVYQADYFDFINAEIDIVKRRLDAGKAVLGVCLGAQIMAAALGADVYKGDSGFESGWSELTLTEEGRNHPVRHFCSSETKLLQWHQDTFDLPEDTVLLASSAQYQNQIFSYGAHGMALQFHPEIHACQSPEWEVMLAGYVKGEEGMRTLKEFRADTDKYVKTANHQTALFFDEWLSSLEL